jgi:hypothetical protein
MGLLLNVAATGGRAARRAPAKPRLEALEGGRDRREREIRGRQRGRAAR